MPNIKVEPTIPNYPPQGIQAQLDLLYLWNPDVANNLIDQINKALEDLNKDLTSYLTKAEAAATYVTQEDLEAGLGEKQDLLTAEQLAAVNSGITAEHVTTYDAYAAEISQAQNDATKAENAAEVAQQTANLAGQEAAQALTALAGKVNIAQGAENAGKVMTVGEDGNLAPADAPSSSAITTDATLTGTGTADSPLGIAQSVQESIDGKLPLAGGEFANGATISLPGTLRIIHKTSPSQYYDITCENATALTFIDNNGYGIEWNMHALSPIKTASMDLGRSGDKFAVAYITTLNNGADITIPTTGGTMALLSDIETAIGTIETALAEV